MGFSRVGNSEVQISWSFLWVIGPILPSSSNPYSLWNLFTISCDFGPMAPSVLRLV
jgi:hypothetical protein